MLTRRVWQQYQSQTIQSVDVKRVLGALLEPRRLYNTEIVKIASGDELKLLVSEQLLQLLFTYDVILTAKMYEVISIFLARIQQEKPGTYSQTALINMLTGHIGAAVAFAFYKQGNLFEQ